MGIEVNSQRNKLHLPRAKDRMFIEAMKLCKDKGAKTTFYDLFLPPNAAKIWNFCLNSSKLMACFCIRMSFYKYAFNLRMHSQNPTPHIYCHMFNHSLSLQKSRKTILNKTLN